MSNRSDFLKTLGAAGAASLAFGPLSIARAAADDSILVVIAQMGGCDFLNTVFSLEQYGRYHDLRRPAISTNDPVLPLLVSEEALAPMAFGKYAFHPRMRAFADLYAHGRLAVVLGVGLPGTESARLSHEAARFDWHSASLHRLGLDGSGWVAAGLQLSEQTVSIAPMISTSSTLPVLFQEARMRGLAIGNTLESYALDVPAASDDEKARRLALFHALQEHAPPGEASAVVYGRSAHVSASLDRVAELAQQYTAQDYPKGDDGELDTQLKSIARLIASGKGARAYFATQDGYDTHAEQNRSHPGLLESFSSSIGRFYSYLRRHDLSSRVLIMTMTDFGRRAASDASFGTDHGTAAASFFIGDAVRGGVYGEYPNLAKLDDDKNLEVPVDFRKQLATAAQHLQIELPSECRAYGAIPCLT
ncbi:MAG: DUF1501 domain-containing protein [Candidatus Eremiobacteraeota bacterium]|nr:DUF1501 domain-containing protein [Candidatus Eremiobacteraeota bacterium]